MKNILVLCLLIPFFFMVLPRNKQKYTETPGY